QLRHFLERPVGPAVPAETHARFLHYRQRGFRPAQPALRLWILSKCSNWLARHATEVPMAEQRLRDIVGWPVVHHFFRIDRARWHGLPPAARRSAIDEF